MSPLEITSIALAVGIGAIIFNLYRAMQRRILTLESSLVRPDSAQGRLDRVAPPSRPIDEISPKAAPSVKSADQTPEPTPSPESDAAFGTPLALSRDEYRHRVQALRTREISLQEQIEAVEADRLKLTDSLARLAGLNTEQAREELFEQLSGSVTSDSMRMPKYLEQRTGSQIEDEARRTLLSVMQRISIQSMQEHTLTQVTIPSEDMKGRLIGREGRNIRSFESETGTTLLIDETPGLVLISAFDPVRREIARQALENLIRDGRIHPANIEDAVRNATGDVEKLTIIIGEEAVTRLKLNSVHPEIVGFLGQLHFRHSNGQNTLSHSIEVASIASLLASEIGLDPVLAKRAGLFHDIGKAMSEEYEGSHAAAAGALLRRYGEPSEVVNAVEASHEEIPAETPYVGLLMLADSLSAARPGARADSTKGFIQRLRSLEDLAKTLPGVSECYALQAGREIRVIVDPDILDDQASRRLAIQLRNRIEEELNYPGRIRITVIRETRHVEEAT